MTTTAEPPLTPFPTTHWTVVARAGAGTAERLRVLGRLLERYLPAMRSYLVATFRFDPHRADDVLQGFLADKILDDDIIRRADQARGRFRGFLVGALHRYTLMQLRRDRAAKRSPAGGHLGSLDAAGRPPDPAAPPGADVFDAAWARRVLQLALDRTRAECDAGGRADVWAVFEARVLRPTLHDQPAVPLAELVAQLGVTATAASNLLVTGKRMFARHLRAVVAGYAVDEQDAQDEIRWLHRTLATP